MTKTKDLIGGALEQARKENGSTGGNIQSAQDFYANLPLDKYENQFKINMPKGPEDLISDPNEPWGKPEGWDYKTAKTGWKGEEMPEGAKGWKPDGTPYWGGDNAFQDWWNSVTWKINAPAEKSGKQYFSEGKQAFQDKDQGFFSRAIGGITSFFSGLGNVGLDEGDDPTLGNKISRGIGQGLLGVGLKLSEAAEFAEQEVFTRVQGLEDIGDAGGVFSMEDKQGERAEKFEARLAEWTNPILSKNVTKAMVFLGEVADLIVPTTIVWNAFRAAISPISIQEKKDIMAERVESGYVLYTTFIEPATKAAYLDRVRQGENPYLVANELQNPWAELGGQAILDPLNLLGWFAKSSGVTKAIGSYTDYMTKPIGQFGDFFKAGASKLLRFDDGSDITLMAERLIESRKTAAGLLDNLSTELNVKGTGVLGGLRPKVNKALEKSGIFSWSNSGKRHHLQRLTSDMMKNIITIVGKDPDEALDIVRYMVKLQSDDVYEVAEALGHLGGSKMPLNMLTSEGGMRFGAVMREMLTDADGVMDGAKFIEKFKSFGDDIPKLQKWLDGKIGKVADELFPPLKKRAAVLGKIEAGEELTAAEKLIDATPLSGGEQFWMKAEQIADNKFLTGINAFFANVYMGLSPGYAMRNLFTNELHLFVDMGPAKYLQSWNKFNPIKGQEALEYMTKGAMGQLANIGIGQGGAGKLFGQKLAGVFEKWGGQRIYGMMYKDSLDKLMPKIIEEVRPMLARAGADEATIKVYESVLKLTHGRFDEAAEMVRQMHKGGKIDLFKTGDWLPDDMLKFFDQHNLGDQVRDIIRSSGGSADVVNSKIDELMDDVYKYIKQTERMIAHQQRRDFDALDGFEHYDELFEGIDDFNVSNDIKAASNHSHMANLNADTKYQLVLDDLRRIAGDQGIELDFADLLPDDLPNREDVLTLLDDVQNSRYYDVPNTTFREKWINPLKEVRNKFRDGNITIEEIWARFPFLRGDPPKGLSSKQLGDLIYNVIQPQETRKYYAPLRDDHARAIELMVKLAGDAGVNLEGPFTDVLQHARDMLKRAQAFDTHIIRDISFDELGRATGDQIRNIAMRGTGYDDYTDIVKMGIINGIETSVLDPASNRTIRTNRLLHTINKELRSMGLDEYQHLDQVPYNMAERALKNRFADKFQPIWRPPQTQIEIPPALTSLLEEAKLTSAKTVTNQMDQRVAEAVKYQADMFLQELDSAQLGGSIWTPPKDVAADAKDVFGRPIRQQEKWGTQYPTWYKKDEVGGASAYYKGKKGRKAVIAALQDIGTKNEGDEAIMVRIRQALLDRLDRTPEDFLQSIRGQIQAYAPEPSEVDDLLGLPQEGAAVYKYLDREVPESVIRSGMDAVASNDKERMLDAFEAISGERPDTWTDQKLQEALTGLVNEATEGGLQVRGDFDDPFTLMRDKYGNLLSEWGLSDDDFLSSAIQVAAPDSFSSPHAYLAAGPQLREKHLELGQLVSENFGRMADEFDNPGLINALDEIENYTAGMEIQMRTIANEYATAGRNFALVNYESRRNIDTLTGLLMPYQFWYGRTYSNWAQRVAKNPAIIANYYRYKKTMARAHAGMPEWWAQNINSYELLGLFKDHPVFYNLEQTLNPLQGLTNVDFEDPHKRVDGWSSMLMDLNRFGPTTHPIYNYAMAFAYMLKGEDEAAARWGGRLIPQTATLNALGSQLGLPGLTKEIDPAVWLFSGGIDPYTRRRVGRAFPQMIAEGMLTPEQAIDAAWSQEGNFWEAARQRAVGERAPGQLASFFLGLGFKGRNQGDMRTDLMYNDFYALMNNRARMSPDQFKVAMGELANKYEFMDSVMISAKTGTARDMAFAYSILKRVAPGDSTRIYDLVGIDNRLVQKFYNSKGDMDDWAESDRRRFMAGIIDMGSILEIPPDYTRTQWTQASAAYTQMNEKMISVFGPEIEDKISHYYALRNDGNEAGANQFLKDNVDVEKAMSWKTDVIVNDPILAPYYSSHNRIYSYHFGQMWTEAKERFGQDIFEVQTEYFGQPNKSAKRQFLNANPRLKEYWDFINEAKKTANSQVVDMVNKLPEGEPEGIRQDADYQGIGAQDLSAGLFQPEDPLSQVTADEWYQTIGAPGFSAIYNYLEDGTDLPRQQKDRLRDTADELGINLDRLIQYVGISLEQNEEIDLPNP